MPATIAIEGAMWAAAVALYLRATSARDRQGFCGLWSLIVVATVTWITGPWSPPPPSVTALTVVSLAMGPVVVLWAIWIERHRGPG